MRKRGRIDGNQVAIVRELRQMGYSVLVMSHLGNGAPDILVGASGRNYAFELKDHNAKPSDKKLTTGEKIFHICWQGQIAVAETTEDICKIIEVHQ